ncbi:MAG: type II toxin-antitoxin system PemK/MazF family toxin [Microlunatus sp.]
MTRLLRGQVVRADVGLAEPKRFLVVSNNLRNRSFEQVLTVRMTTTSKPERPSIVKLGAADAPHGGFIVCDDIVTVWEDEVIDVLAGVSPLTMHRVELGLLAALGISVR